MKKYVKKKDPEPFPLQAVNLNRVVQFVSNKEKEKKRVPDPNLDVR